MSDMSRPCGEWVLRSPDPTQTSEAMRNQSLGGDKSFGFSVAGTEWLEQRP